MQWFQSFSRLVSLCTSLVTPQSEFIYFTDLPTELQILVLQHAIYSTRNSTELKDLCVSLNESCDLMSDLLTSDILKKAIALHCVQYAINEIELKDDYLSSKINVLKRGIDDKDAQGNTFLMLAARNRDCLHVALALEAGANVNAQNNNNETAAMLVLKRRKGYQIEKVDEKIVTTLVALMKDTINLNVFSKDRETALTYALQFPYTKKDSSINNMKQIVRLFINHGADINLATLPPVDTPIEIAVFFLNHPNVIQELLNNNVKIPEERYQLILQSAKKDRAIHNLIETYYQKRRQNQ